MPRQPINTYSTVGFEPILYKIKSLKNILFFDLHVNTQLLNKNFRK